MAKKQKSQLTEQSKEILKLRAKGLSIVEIGKVFGISRQRVYYIIITYGDNLPKRLEK
jgi:DNA-binding CsgD family transcriptional regulator